jgi:hypothetical protein
LNRRAGKAAVATGNLTRRANHRHIFIIAGIQSPRRETGRGLSQSESGSGTCAHFTRAYQLSYAKSPEMIGDS